MLGGVVGAVLLLLTPSEAFEKLVPFLIAGAALAILLQRPPAELALKGEQEQAAHPHRDFAAGRSGCSRSRSMAATSARPPAS